MLVPLDLSYRNLKKKKTGGVEYLAGVQNFNQLNKKKNSDEVSMLSLHLFSLKFIKIYINVRTSKISQNTAWDGTGRHIELQNGHAQVVGPIFPHTD